MRCGMGAFRRNTTVRDKASPATRQPADWPMSAAHAWYSLGTLAPTPAGRSARRRTTVMRDADRLPSGRATRGHACRNGNRRSRKLVAEFRIAPAPDSPPNRAEASAIVRPAASGATSRGPGLPAGEPVGGVVESLPESVQNKIDLGFLDDERGRERHRIT